MWRSTVPVCAFRPRDSYYSHRTVQYYTRDPVARLQLVRVRIISANSLVVWEKMISAPTV